MEFEKKSYDEYLKEHREAFIQCFIMLTGSTGHDAYKHDESKNSPEEYIAYRNYFYPEDRPSNMTDEEARENFKKACVYHYNRNPHHWQHWIYMPSPNKFEAVEMPEKHVYEMVADWGAFAFLKKKGSALVSWYEENRYSMLLHPLTRVFVDHLVEELAEDIDIRFGEA